MAKQPKNLLTATKEERQEFLDSFDYIFTDCDGTVWDQNGPFDGLSETMKTLKAKGKQVVYVSNNATRNAEEYDQRFQKYNYDVDVKTNLVTPGTSVVDYLRSIDFKGTIYVLGTKVLKDLITENGFDVLDEDPLSPIDDTLSALYSFGAAPHKVSAVYFDFPVNMTFKQIVRAQMILTDPKVHFIVGATETIIPLGRPLLGTGAFIKVLEETTNRKAVVLGKPGAALRDILVAKYKITDPKRVLFVGDMPEQDAGFGNASGFQTLAVLFERTEEQLLSNTNPLEIANFWLPRFADLRTVFGDLN